MVEFRPARVEDAADLSELAFRSKAYWGYPAEFMQACREELNVDAETIEAEDCFYEVAIKAGRIAGFYALEGRGRSIELDALFVEPQDIGKGIGRRLIERARARAAALGAEILTIQGDPNAIDFYHAAGALLIGERESGSIPGRMLPLLEIDLARNARGNPAS